MKNGEGFPARDGCTSEKNVVIRKYGQTPGCQGRFAIATEREQSPNLITEANASNEWKLQFVTKLLKPNVLTNPREGNGHGSHQQRQWSSCGEEGAAKCTHLEKHEARPKMQGCQSLQDLTESRPVQSTHGEVMRLGEQNFCKLQLVRRVPP